MTVADLRAARGSRALTMLYVATPAEAAAAGAGVDVLSNIAPLVTCGMGASSGADAQYLLAEDVLGCRRGHRLPHARSSRSVRAAYGSLQAERVAAFSECVADVAAGAYPGPEHDVAIGDGERAAFLEGLEHA